MKTAVDYLVEQLNEIGFHTIVIQKVIDKAKEMERKERLKYQLFIGKVDEIVGFDKTLELLKECNNKIL